jgi:hypothetical protein
MQYPDWDTVDHAYKIAIRALKHQTTVPKKENHASDEERIVEHITDGNTELDDEHVKGDLTQANKSDLTSQNISTLDIVDEDLETQSSASISHYIYLVKPMTRGSQKVLIPINSNTKLRDALQNQEVIEFPTLQVLSQSPDRVSSSFILEPEYLLKFNMQEKEMKELVASDIGFFSSEQPNAEEQTNQTPHRISNTDDILAILQRDIHEI